MKHEERQEAYRDYVEGAAREGLQHIPWAALQAQVVLGDETFLHSLSHRAHGDEQEQPSLRHMKRRPEFDTVVGVVEHLKEER